MHPEWPDPILYVHSKYSGFTDITGRGHREQPVSGFLRDGQVADELVQGLFGDAALAMLGDWGATGCCAQDEDTD